jgi:hypothetical protein
VASSAPQYTRAAAPQSSHAFLTLPSPPAAAAADDMIALVSPTLSRSTSLSLYSLARSSPQDLFLSGSRLGLFFVGFFLSFSLGREYL